jgi:hypothetical protein
MDVYVSGAKNEMLSVNFCVAILVNHTAVSVELAEVVQEGAAGELHQPNLRGAVDYEVGTESAAINNRCIHLH